MRENQHRHLERSVVSLSWSSSPTTTVTYKPPLIEGCLTGTGLSLEMDEPNIMN
jgi:hypothetical protein